MGGVPITNDRITLIRDLLVYLKEDFDAPIYASLEDASYFRKTEIGRIPEKIASPPPLPPHQKKEAMVQPPPPPPVVHRETEKAISNPIPTKKEEEPQPSPIPADFSSLRELLQKIAPGFPILDTIPSDAVAKKISTRWKTKNQTVPISILSFQEPPAQRALLEQIAKALDVYFGPARLVQAESIEKEKQWETFLSVPELKLMIICDYSLWQMGHLMQFYKEIPAAATRTLGSVPLFLLPDLSLYLKDPLLKRSLWKALCQKLSS